MVKTGRRHTFPFIHLCGCSSGAEKGEHGGEEAVSGRRDSDRGAFRARDKESVFKRPSIVTLSTWIQ